MTCKDWEDELSPRDALLNALVPCRCRLCDGSGSHDYTRGKSCYDSQECAEQIEANVRAELAALRAKLDQVRSLCRQYAPIMAADNTRVSSPYAHWHVFGRSIKEILEEK